METAETRKKLADGIKTLRTKGDEDGVSRLVSAYKTKYKATKPGRYEVPKIQETREQKIARYNTEADAANKEKEKNTGFGYVKNFGKELVKNLAPAEVGLGDTIAKVGGQNSEEYAGHIKKLSDDQLKIQKMIKEREARGEDTTALKRGFNSNADLIDELGGNIQKENEALPSGWKAAGQLGGTALDLLSAGTYGKSTKGMKSFQLALPESTVGATVAHHLTTAEQIAKELPDAPISKVADDTLKQISMSLERAGLTDDAAKILTIDATKIKTIADLNRMVNETVKLSTVLPSVIPKGQAGFKAFAKDVLPGVAVGYGYDVTNALSEDKPLDEALQPGLGTALGAGIPIAGKLSSKLLGKALIPAEEKLASQATKTIQKREEDLIGIESGYQKIRKAQEYNPQFSESRSRVANSDVLVDSVDESGVIRTKGTGGAIDQYRAETTDKAESVVYDLLEKEGATIKADSLLTVLKNSIKNSTLPAKEMQSALKESDAIVAAYVAQFPDGKIPLSYLQEQKIKESKLINYQTPPEKNALNKALSRGINDSIKSTSRYNIDGVNKELQKYYKDIEYLELLDGKRVKGGKLGKYFARAGGYLAGNIAGNAVGGPLGSIVGTVAGGELADKITAKMLQGTFGERTGTKIPTSKVVNDAVREAAAPRLQLPAPKPGTPQKSNNIPIQLPKESQSTIDERELKNPNIKRN